MSNQSLGVGRELDALVAEKVMGWRWMPYWVSGQSEQVTDLFPPYGVGDFDSHGQFPEYSTDSKAAWLVVEEIRKRGWVYCTVQSLPSEAEAPEWDDATMSVQWWAEFSRYRSPVEATSPHCTTAVEAICLAALQAVGA